MAGSDNEELVEENRKLKTYLEASQKQFKAIESVLKEKMQDFQELEEMKNKCRQTEAKNLELEEEVKRLREMKSIEIAHKDKSIVSIEVMLLVLLCAFVAFLRSVEFS
eukprot:CAMPEP_0197515340 /NCGR_PEP_ID=MMETSP1318-20131121/506_1 /TAXON_ID=552666 /ORGANISM="Partenskyella glossopodia, Strain RCC365" /LENGTH=107 /DNA_ID=CAMNT_0043063687 /DNA_START=74 /DNA_END=394 /DNA_ORIENTATION=-